MFFFSPPHLLCLNCTKTWIHFEFKYRLTFCATGATFRSWVFSMTSSIVYFSKINWLKSMTVQKSGQHDATDLILIMQILSLYLDKLKDVWFAQWSRVHSPEDCAGQLRFSSTFNSFCKLPIWQKKCTQVCSPQFLHVEYDFKMNICLNLLSYF